MRLTSDPLLLVELLALLGIANGAPVFATKLFKDRFATPLDGDLELPDGQPLFGASKTIRGVLASVACTTLGALLMGLGWSTGTLLAIWSMAGDLAASFVKRRLKLKVHARAFGLDQIPEALLPLLLLQSRLGLGWVEIGLLVVAFLLLEIVLSKILFRLRIREQPYRGACPRKCHQSRRHSRCKVTSGGQLRRTSTIQVPAPTEVYPIMSW